MRNEVAQLCYVSAWALLNVVTYITQRKGRINLWHVNGAVICQRICLYRPNECYRVFAGAIDIEIAMLAIKAWTEDRQIGEYSVGCSLCSRGARTSGYLPTCFYYEKDNN